MSNPNFLTDDSSMLPPEQKFVCLSFLTDKENNTTLSGVKVRGVFETYEQACEHAKRLQTLDPYFNIFVGHMGKWLPFDPAPDSKLVENSEYANEQLNTMMKAYMENQEKAKLYHEQRKNEQVRKIILDNLSNRQDNLRDLELKLRKTTNPDEKFSLQQSYKSVEDQINEMENKKKDLDSKLEELTKQIELFSVNKPFVGPKVVPSGEVDEVVV